METTMTIEQIIEAINEMDTNEIFDLNNTFCDEANYFDDVIYCNDDDFFDMAFSSKMEAVRAAVYGNYSYHHDFVKFDGYGNLESFDRLTADNLPDMVQNIAEYIHDNFEAFEYLFNQ